MFAVPGWSISANSLKTETKSPGPAAKNSNSSNPQTRDENKSKKRKRAQDSHSGVRVTSENLEELWKRHIQSEVPFKQANNPSDKSEGRRTKSKKERKKASRIADTSQILEAPPALGAQKVTEAAEPKSDSRNEKNGLAKYERRMAKAKQKHENKSPQHKSSGAEQLDDEKISEIKGASTSASKTTRISPSSEAIPQPANISKPSTQDGPLANGAEPGGDDSSKSTTISPLSNPPNPKLTPLQQRMAQKLVSARFRHLNETLYTSPSAKAMALFTSSPQAYGAYHAGFRAQVSVWPSNPVDQFVRQIRERGAVRSPFRDGYRNDSRSRGQRNFKGRHGKDRPAPPSGSAASTGTDSLPRHPTTHVCHIVDLGCGDAVLAASLSNPETKNTRLKLSIRSFDLAPGDGPHASLVSVADITDLRPAGVADASVNLAICCLSLMSTNWVRVVDECARIVRGGSGEVWVAEIRSRFVTPARGRRNPGTPLLPKGAAAAAAAVEKGDKKQKKGQQQHRGRQADNEADGDEVEAEEYFSDLEDRATAPPGAAASADTSDTTDVSAFVDVWRRRGFALRGEPDVGNKMFVTMRFVKERWSSSSAAGAAAAGRGQREGGEGEGEEEEEVVAEEGKVLKPCLYKTR